MPAPPTVTTGVRATNVGINQDRRIVDMRDRIYQYDPDKSPTLTILSVRPGSSRAGNPVFKHLEDQPLPWWDLTSATQTTTDTAIEVDNGAYFRGGDLVLVPDTGEVFKVVSVAANTLTVVRNYNGDGVTGVAMDLDEELAIIGNVNEEFSGTRTIKTTVEATIENFLQILKTPVGASNTLEASDLYGGKERPYQRKKMGTQHAFEQERAFLFGKKKEALGANGRRERSTGGILQWITSIVDNASGTLTAATLESWCEKLFRHGSKTKLVLASRRAGSQLDLIAEGRLQTVPRADTYGVAVRRFVSAHGELLITTHDMLERHYAGHMIGLDMENLGKRYNSDGDGVRDARLRTNIQLPDEDGWKDEYLSEVGLHVYLENAHGVMEGIA